MNKVERLIEKCSDLTPLDGRILIIPMRLRTFKTIGHTSEAITDKGGKPQLTEDGVPEMMMVEKEMKQEYRFQRAIVSQKSKDEDRFEIGDIIIFKFGTVDDFDLIKGISIIRRFDIIAVEK